MKKRATILMLTGLAVAAVAANPEADSTYFHPAASFFIQGNTAGASNLVARGLAEFPDDGKLKRLKELLENKQQQDQQKNDQQQDQEQQDQQQDEQQDQEQQNQNDPKQDPADQQDQQQQDQQQQQLTPEQARELLKQLEQQDKKQKVQPVKAKKPINTPRPW